MGRHDEQVRRSEPALRPSQQASAGRSYDVLEGAGARPGRSWSQWSAGRRRTAVVVVLLVLAILLALGADRVQGWQHERDLRDRVSVDAELGVDASSWAWSRSGRGRVEYFLVLRNASPRPARMTRVVVEHPGLSISGRALSRAPVPPGEVVYVPLDVELDCRRWRLPERRSAPDGWVAVVAASGRSARVPVAVGRADPLTGVARTLCRLDRGLRIADMSGPVQVRR